MFFLKILFTNLGKLPLKRVALGNYEKTKQQFPSTA